MNNNFDDGPRLTPLNRFISFSSDLSQHLIDKLLKHGLKTTNHLRLLTNEDLEKLYGFDEKEINEINDKLKPNAEQFESITAIELDQNTESIKCGSKNFDEAFGGHHGLPTRRLTQIFGEAGVGKSQICFQLCFRVQLPIEEGGLNGEALYFDTENSFRPERILQIAENYYEKNHRINGELLKNKCNEVLNRIHVKYIKNDAKELFELIVEKLDSFLETHSDVRLFVLDGIAYHFRYDYEYDDRTRTRQLSEIAQKLKQIAYERSIAILITNQVRFKNEPALGELWNTKCSTSLSLVRLTNAENDQEIDSNIPSGNSVLPSIRRCLVVKSPSINSNVCFEYQINESGIIDNSCENS